MMTMVIILLDGWSIKEMRAISPWWRKLYELKAAGADALPDWLDWILDYGGDRPLATDW